MASSSSALLVAFNPVPTAGRVARFQSLRLRIVVQTLLAVAVVIVVLAIAKVDFDTTTVAWPTPLWAVLLAVLWAVQAVRLRSARKDLLGIGEGTALRVDDAGVAVRTSLRNHGDFDDTTSAVQVAGAPEDARFDQVNWQDLTRFAVEPSHHEPILVVEQGRGEQLQRWQVPTSWLGAAPQAIDMAAMQCSGGRQRLECVDQVGPA